MSSTVKIPFSKISKGDIITVTPITMLEGVISVGINLENLSVVVDSEKGMFELPLIDAIKEMVS